VTQSRWLLPSTDPRDVEALSSALRIAAPAARILVHRGLGDPAAARRFLQPSLDDLHNPLTMRDMPRAVARLEEAIRDGQKILIYGDYDVDGAASVVILTKAIELAGGAAGREGRPRWAVSSMARSIGSRTTPACLSIQP